MCLMTWQVLPISPWVQEWLQAVVRASGGAPPALVGTHG